MSGIDVGTMVGQSECTHNIRATQSSRPVNEESVDLSFPNTSVVEPPPRYIFGAMMIAGSYGYHGNSGTFRLHCHGDTIRPDMAQAAGGKKAKIGPKSCTKKQTRCETCSGYAENWLRRLHVFCPKKEISRKDQLFPCSRTTKSRFEGACVKTALALSSTFPHLPFSSRSKVKICQRSNSRLR